MSEADVSCPVQELLIRSKVDLPERYVYKGNDSIGTSFPVIDVPAIDLSLITSSSPSGKEELDKLRSSLSSCGFVQAVNHGMTSSFLEKMHRIGKQFFALPIEEKQKYARTADEIEGYGNDSVLSEHQSLDWSDRLYLTINPEDQRKLNLWPENPQIFREALSEYSKKLQMLTQVILKAMANSLNLEENCFLNQYGEQSQATMIARYNFYPPCPRPDLILGVKPHADGSAITFLLQDEEVEGLQVLQDDQWFSVPVIPKALLVNVGDQAEIMSNGIFKSAVHRVVTNTQKKRLTLAVFCMPHADREIEPATELINDGRPRLYKKVKNFVGLFFKNYQHGKRPIDLVKI